MPRAKRAPSQDQLEMEADLIEARPVELVDVGEHREAVTPHQEPDAEPMPEEAADDREPFGGWLLKQAKCGRWYAGLVPFAKADKRFPKSGDPDAVRKHMEAGGADGEVMDMLDDAERDWNRG